HLIYTSPTELLAANGIERINVDLCHLFLLCNKRFRPYDKVCTEIERSFRELDWKASLHEVLEMKEYVRVMHLADVKKEQRIDDTVALGEGDLDLALIVKMSRVDGWNPIVTIELKDGHRNFNAVRRSIYKLREFGVVC
ncbi:MAG: hypothetical protein ABIG30_02965, partial [Candidatus Aenigmatarchaeota archaeon]